MEFRYIYLVFLTYLSSHLRLVTLREPELQSVHDLPVEPGPPDIHRHSAGDGGDDSPAGRLLPLLPLLRQETGYSAGEDNEPRSEGNINYNF